MNIEIKKIEELIEYKNNPRKNDAAVEYVAKSIKEFGFKVPIIIDENNVIVAGHTRYKASKLLGLLEVPCIVANDLSDEQIKAFRLVDNKSAEFSSWDIDLLNIELENIKDINMDLFDFKVDTILEDVIDDEYDVVLPENPKTKLGNIYQLGNHLLMCGNSTNQDDVNLLMKDQKADLFLTDPPYNVNYEGKTKDALKILNDNQNEYEFKKLLVDSFRCADAVMKFGAIFYIWHADSEGYNVRGACFDVGWKVRQCLIWNKNSFVLGRQDYQWKHEPCLYGWKEGIHNWYSDRSQTTVLEFNRPSKSENHPTMKPVDLFAYQIKNSTKENDLILDLYGGSGTTIICAEQLNRRCFMMELDPKYCDVIINRWEKFTNKRAILLNEVQNDAQ